MIRPNQHVETTLDKSVINVIMLMKTTDRQVGTPVSRTQ